MLADMRWQVRRVLAPHCSVGGQLQAPRKMCGEGGSPPLGRAAARCATNAPLSHHARGGAAAYAPHPSCTRGMQYASMLADIGFVSGPGRGGGGGGGRGRTWMDDRSAPFNRYAAHPGGRDLGHTAGCGRCRPRLRTVHACTVPLPIAPSLTPGAAAYVALLTARGPPQPCPPHPVSCLPACLQPWSRRRCWRRCTPMWRSWMTRRCRVGGGTAGALAVAECSMSEGR